MKKLAVVITTHISHPKQTYHRNSNYHGLGDYEDILFKYFKDVCIKNYTELDSGLKDSEWDIYLVDTGSPHHEYQEWVIECVNLRKLKIIRVQNNGGAWAGLKTFMHTHSYISQNYENFIFHVDDGVEVIKDGWAVDILEKYNNHDNLGIMGRSLETIDLGPNGLPQHRSICGHIATMWGLKEVTTIPHLHGDYWVMDQKTLLDLGRHWWDPIESLEAMNYQAKYEQMDFAQLFHYSLQETGTQKYFEDMHIGREVEMPLRMEALLNKRLATYENDGIFIKADQIHHRQDEILQKVTS